MKLVVTIVAHKFNAGGIDFLVKDGKGELWVILDCQIKERFQTILECYYGQLGSNKYGFNQGHPVHLNQLRKDYWELLIE